MPAKTPSKRSFSPVRKTLLILAISVGVLVLLVFIFISPITRYLVERYDQKYTGREIRMKWAFVNPFTGYVHLEGLEISEADSTTTFIKMDALNLDFAMAKMPGGLIEISEMTLIRPWFVLQQTDTTFNIDDLIVRFASKDSVSNPKKEPVRFNLLTSKIENGEFHFRETTIPVHYFVQKLNLTSSGIQWDKDSTQAEFSFRNGMSTGKIQGNIGLNISSLAYRSKLNIQTLDLQFFEQYLRQIAKYGRFRAVLDADILASGNFRDARDVDSRMTAQIRDLHFGKDIDNDYTSIELLRIRSNRVNPNAGIYDFDTISVVRPYFKYERYSRGDNIQTMFGGKLAQVSADSTQFNLIIELARYIQKMGEHILEAEYKVNRLSVSKGHFIFNDYTLPSKFSVATDSLSLTGTGINKSKPKVNLHLQTGLIPNGNIDIDLTLYPHALKDFDATYHLEKVPMVVFNPYLVSATSYPMERGSLELKGQWNVRNGQIQSQNNLLMLDPRVSDRVKNRQTPWIPVPLILAFVRERGNVMSYSIPIKGNLNAPGFSIWDPVFDALKNMIIKPPTVPYGLLVTHVENKLEQWINLKWETHSARLRPNSERSMKQLSQFLKDNPNARIAIQPEIFEDLEKETIAIYEAKKAFFLLHHPKARRNFSESDSLSVEKTEIDSKDFQNYLTDRITDPLLFTTQHKSLNVLGEDRVNREYAQLSRNRRRTFLSWFQEGNQTARIRFSPDTKQQPFNGISLYKIRYEGVRSEKLTALYERYQNLNDDLPRKKFQKKRPFWRNFF